MAIATQIAGDIGITHMVQLIKNIMSNPKDTTQVRQSMRWPFPSANCPVPILTLVSPFAVK